MTMNNRQIDLQFIIRNLQNKILIQKQENKILSERCEQRLRQGEEENNRKIHEKQRMIQYLTLQLDKDRQIIMNEQYLYDSKRVKEKQEIYIQYERLKHKNNELQKKLQFMIEKYELQKKDLEIQIKKYQQKQYDESFSRASIENEIEKLNKFYHQSRADQPKRKQLIEWAQKLSILINKTQNENSKTIEQLFGYVKNNLETFKSQLMQSLSNASEFEEQILKSKRDILANIQQIIGQENKTKNQMIQNNDKIYDILKKQRFNTQIEKIHQLQKELTQTRKKSLEGNQQLTNRIKSLQGQRKTLLLGFTELKTLNQTRQKTYKEEIQALKETIEGLLTTGQRRESQFEKQMKILHGQLTSISQRYYENIQVPLTKIASKLDCQIKTARTELQKLSQNRGFIKSIQSLEGVMQKYIVQNTNSTKINNEINDYIRKTGDLIYYAQQIFQDQNDRQLISKQFGEQPKQNIPMQNKIDLIQSNLKEVEWKQKENKLMYQLTTAKKYNKKLKQYCTSLQEKGNGVRNVSPIKRSRITPSNNKNSANDIAQNPTKIYELQAEIEKLTLSNKSYSDQYLFQLNVIKEHIGRFTGKQVKDQKNLLNMQKGIKQIIQFNQKLQMFLDKENSHMGSIREILSTLNRILLKPVQTFDNFIEKLTNCYQAPSLNPSKINKQYSEIYSFNLFSSLQQVYLEVHNKRQQNNTHTSKLLSQFIKILRETTPNHPKYHVKAVPANEVDNGHLEKSRVATKQYGVEKRIKDLQNLRMKSRQQTLKRLEKIEQSLKNIEGKYSKRHFINLNRIQESITRKIDQLRQKCLYKIQQNSGQINQITGTILKDIKNKLKQCMNQNEGLTKQVQLLQKYKKKQQK